MIKKNRWYLIKNVVENHLGEKITHKKYFKPRYDYNISGTTEVSASCLLIIENSKGELMDTDYDHSLFLNNKHGFYWKPVPEMEVENEFHRVKRQEYDNLFVSGKEMLSKYAGSI